MVIYDPSMQEEQSTQIGFGYPRSLFCSRQRLNNCNAMQRLIINLVIALTGLAIIGFIALGFSPLLDDRLPLSLALGAGVCLLLAFVGATKLVGSLRHASKDLDTLALQQDIQDKYALLFVSIAALVLGLALSVGCLVAISLVARLYCAPGSW